MKVITVSTFEAFRDLRAPWARVYATDPDAQIYLSWEWLANWLSLVRSDWLILAAWDETLGDYVAFLPIRIRTQRARKGGCYTEIAMAGNRFADDTGFLCRPNYATPAIIEIMRSLQTIRFAQVRFENLRIRPDHLAILLKCLPKHSFDTQNIASREAETGTDHSICPFATLPETSDAFLAGLSSNSRQKLRRLQRKVAASAQLEIRHSTSASIEHDLGQLLEFWRARWRPRKQHHTDNLANNLNAVLRRCFDDGQLDLVSLWDRGHLVAAHANLIDEPGRTTSFVVGARDTSFTGPSPGLILHAHSIARAIELGHTTYDFLRGDEPYKFQFANACRRLHNLVVKAKPARIAQGCLDWRSVPQAIRIADECVASDDLPGAQIIFRQLVRLGSAGERALADYGERAVAAKRGAAAVATFEILVREAQDNARFHLGLGCSYCLTGAYDRGAAAFEKAVCLAPQLAPAHYYLGALRQAHGALADAERCFRNVSRIDSNYRDTSERLQHLIFSRQQSKGHKLNWKSPIS